MKKIILFAITILLFSCSTHTQQGQTYKNIVNLSKTERTIINTFLEFELNKDQYNRFKNYKYIVIEEALKKTKPLSAYELNYNYKKSWGRDIKFWILDSVQIKKIKKDIENEGDYHWKTTDFKDFKVSLLKFEELRKTTNTGEYLENNLIIYLSRPLIIDNNNALVSFEIGKGDVGFYPITHFTVLMRKVNNKWVINGYYEDGVF